jgi:hypothetical protein
LPKPWLDSNRVNGRLRLDFYLADCAFSQGRLEFGAPRMVGRRQASFMMPQLTLHGEHIAIIETMDMSEQPEDHAAFEEEVRAEAGPCVHIFRANGTSPVTAVNRICSHTSGGDMRRMYISPNANYVAITGRKEFVIVGREYRNDGTGPAWLKTGVQP